jgi:eukaryotic-like serine/threonine-protein kinase
MAAGWELSQMVLVLDRDAPRSERFEIVSRLGAGGMGVVYLALDRKRNVRVALKSLPRLDPDRLLLFKREFRALQDVQHPNLVGLGELFEEEGRWFFTLEFVEGQDIFTWVRSAVGAGDPAGSTTPVDEVPTIIQTERTLPDLARIDPRRASLLNEPKPSAAFDEARLRSAFAQLAEGLMALHAAGKVHRDIKPANVLVTGEGRVVVLDFGLVLDIQEVKDAPQESQLTAGTLAYMAPEQTSTAALKASADWYSFGVVLYQALTCVLPFPGSPLQMMMAKVRGAPPPPRALLREIPEDLDALCAKLLALDPAARPGGEEILRVLQAGAARSEKILEPRPPRSTFVGRAEELEELKSALEETKQGSPVFVTIIGESGLGKSALARRFGEIAAEDHGALVLSGRCYTRESIRFKGFDGVVDALAAHLKRIGEGATALLPEGASVLAHVFPVLRRVKDIANGLESLAGADPLELRMRAFGVLRALLARLAKDRPLVMYLDDLQWADEDSLTLLSEILRAPGAPAILVTATLRPGWESALDRFANTRRIVLAPLPQAASEELALRLLAESSPEAREGAKALASDAAGHPLFIQELVRATLDLGPEKARGLDEVMKARIDRLEPEGRLLLELVCVAGAPLAEDTLARAAAQDALAFDRAMASVRTRTFVRISSAQDDDRAVEPYHDRVREAAVTDLGAVDLADRHRRIAEALEAVGARDLEPLALHWSAAGEKEKAARYAAEAAAGAMQTLAFNQAARLYRFSLELRSTDDLERRSLEISLAEALVAAGQPGEAAESFLRAAAGAPRSLAIDLKRRASEQFIRMGRVEDGVAIAADAMKELGISIPGRKRAIASVLAQRLRIRLRGHKFTERSPSEIPPELLLKSDMTFSFATSMPLLNPLLGMYFHGMHMLLALECGDPVRVARAMPFEIGWLAVSGHEHMPRVLAVAEHARELAERCKHPYAMAMYHFSSGVARVAWGMWTKAREHLLEAKSILRECRGVTWEVFASEAYIMRGSIYLGDFPTLRERLRAILGAAEQGGHAFMLIPQRMAGGMAVALSEDDPARGRKIVGEVQNLLPQQHGPVMKYLEWFTLNQADLYEGDFTSAYDRVVSGWPVLERMGVFMSSELAIEAIDVKTRAFGGRLRAATTSRDRDRFAKEIQRGAQMLEKKRWGWAEAMAAHHRAVLASLEADDASVVRAIDQAMSRFEACEMRVHAAALRWRKGERLGGSEGRSEIEAAQAAMRACGVVNPRGFLRMITPGFEVPA